MSHTECHLQHALSTTRRLTFNRNVSKLLDFVLQRQNPYSVTIGVPVPLCNLLTKVAVDKNVSTRLLMFHRNGECRYQTYRLERLVKKIKKINMIISMSKLPK